jgi:hypothetical protein
MEDVMKKRNLIALFAWFALVTFTVGIGFAQSVQPGEVVTATENMPLLPSPPSRFIGIKDKPISEVKRGQRYRVHQSLVIKALPQDQTWIQLTSIDDSSGKTGWALFKTGNEIRFTREGR